VISRTALAKKIRGMVDSAFGDSWGVSGGCPVCKPRVLAPLIGTVSCENFAGFTASTGKAEFPALLGNAGPSARNSCCPFSSGTRYVVNRRSQTFHYKRHIVIRFQFSSSSSPRRDRASEWYGIERLTSLGVHLRRYR